MIQRGSRSRHSAGRYFKVAGKANEQAGPPARTGAATTASDSALFTVIPSLAPPLCFSSIGLRATELTRSSLRVCSMCKRYAGDFVRYCFLASERG